MLADNRYADCPKKSLPSVTVYPTARHSTGILHATGDYFGGPWHDGVEAELDGVEDARVRGYGRALCIFTVTGGAMKSEAPHALVCWYSGDLCYFLEFVCRFIDKLASTFSKLTS